MLDMKPYLRTAIDGSRKFLPTVAGLGLLIGTVCLNSGCSIPFGASSAMDESGSLYSTAPQDRKEDYVTIGEDRCFRIKRVVRGIVNFEDYQGPMEIIYRPKGSEHSTRRAPIILEEWYDACTNRLIYSNVKEIPGLVWAGPRD